jgi:hypothetical protein
MFSFAPLGRFWVEIRWKIGNKKPSVFPLPVFATAITSFPETATGQALA